MCTTQKPEDTQSINPCNEKNTASCQGTCDAQQMKVEHSIIVMLEPIKKDRPPHIKKP